MVWWGAACPWAAQGGGVVGGRAVLPWRQQAREAGPVLLQRTRAAKENAAPVDKAFDVSRLRTSPPPIMSSSPPLTSAVQPSPNAPMISVPFVIVYLIEAPQGGTPPPHFLFQAIL